MDLIRPDWPAPSRVRAVSTTRAGGLSQGPYDSLNLGDHVGDDPATVASNRRRLADHLGLPAEPCWLRQVHGCTIVRAATVKPGAEADGAVADIPGAVCAVMTADCLPLLMCDEQGTCVCAVHAGWRGLADGVIEAGVAAMDVAPERILAWLGPAIGPISFEVGAEVRARFLAHDPVAAAAFTPVEEDREEDRWMADLFLIACQRLARLGVEGIYGGGDCTYAQPDRFFSFRRDGETGRMASLIWLAADD